MNAERTIGQGQAPFPPTLLFTKEIRILVLTKPDISKRLNQPTSQAKAILRHKI